MSDTSTSGMTHAEMLTALSIENGQISTTPLTISSDQFPTSIGQVIGYCYGGQPIIIDNPTLVADHGESGGVEITGTSECLGMPNLPVTIYAKIEDTDQLKMDLSYTLIGSSPDPVFWTLSKSVPGLARPNPAEDITFDRESGTATQPTHRPLDDLKFYETSFWVTNRDSHTHPVTGVELEWGINFVSMVIPEGPLAMVENLLGHSEDLKVSGTIRKPRIVDTTDILTIPYGGGADGGYHPWNTKDDFEFGLPGAHLKIHLGIDYSIVAGEVEFAAEYLNLYMPFNESWSVDSTKPTFEPQQAYSGYVTLPDAGITMDFNVPFEFGVDFLSFNSLFEGMSLSNLSQLTGLAGNSENLMSHLPQELQDLADGLGALSLMRAYIDLDFRNLSQIHVSKIGFRIGMPDVTWEIWEDHFSVGGFWSEFVIDYPFQVAGSITDPDQQRSVELKVGGSFQIEGIDFNVKASSKENFTVYAEMAADNTLPLGNILNTFGAGIDNPGDLTIDSFRVAVSPGSSYNLAMGMNEEGAGWGLEIGPQTFDISDVYVNLSKAKGQDASASIGGVLTLDELGRFDIDYDSPGDISIVSFLDEVPLGSLIQTLVGNVVNLPSGFDFDLEDVNVVIQKDGTDYKFEIMTEIEGLGYFAMIVNKVNGSWGFAFGIETFAKNLTDLPGLSALSVLEELGTPSSLLVIVSSIERPAFRWPSVAQFNNPELDSAEIPVPKGDGLTDGLNLYSSWSFDNQNDDNKGINALLGFLGLSGALDVIISVPSEPMNGSRLYMNYGGNILNNCYLDAQFGLQLSNGRPGVFLGGNMDVSIKGNPYKFSVAMSVMTTGIYFSGSMVGTISFEGIQLSNLGLMLGINWALLPSLGIMCSIDTADFSTSLAMIFDSGDPTKSVLAGSISDIHLKGLAEGLAEASVPAELTDVLETISIEGVNEFDLPLSLVDALDNRDQTAVAAEVLSSSGIVLPSDYEGLAIVVNKEGEKWSLNDVRDNMKHYELELQGDKIVGQAKAQFYLATNEVALGSYRFYPGFRVMGALSVLGLTWTTDIEISKQEGIAALSYLDDDLVIWNQDFFRLSDASGTTGPRFSMATYNRPEQTEAMYRTPHFILDGQLTLMGVTTTAFVKLNSGGFEFEVGQEQGLTYDAGIFSGSYDLDWTINGGIDTSQGIQIGGDLDFDLKGKFRIADLVGSDLNMGNVSVDLKIATTLVGNYDGSTGSLDVTGSFEFANITFDFNFSLDGETEGLTRLAGVVFRQVKIAMIDLYTEAEKWIAAVGDVIEDLGDNITAAAEVMGKWFNKTGAEVGGYLQGLGADASRIGTELVNNALVDSEEALGQILKDLEFDHKDIGSALNSAMGASAETVASVIQTIGWGHNEVSEALSTVFSHPSHLLAPILKDLNFTPNEITEALSGVYEKTMAAIGTMLNDLEYAEDVIAGAFRDVLNATEEQVGKVLKDLNKGAGVVGSAVATAFSSSVESVATMIQNIGWGHNEISQALSSAFSHPSHLLGPLLGDMGYSAHQVTEALSGVYNKSAAAIGTILDDMQQADDVIAGALNSAIGTTKEAIASILDDLGRSSSDIAKALDKAFTVSATELSQIMDSALNISGSAMAGILKDMGKGANEIAGIMEGVFNEGTAAVGSILKGLQYGATDIGDALDSAFTVSAADVGGILKNLQYGATDIGNALENAFSVSASDVAKVLKDLQYSTTDIGNALESAFNSSYSDVADILHDLGYSFTDIGNSLRYAFGRGMTTTMGTLKGLESDASKIATAIKSVYSTTYSLVYQSIISTFSSLGFNADEIGKACHDVFNISSSSMSLFLKYIGSSVESVAKVLDQIYGESAEATTQFLRNAGYSATEAGKALYSYFGDQAEDSGKMLAKAGYAASDIAKTLRSNSFWDKNSDATGRILKRAGFSKSVTESALKAAGWSSKTVKNIIKSIF